MNEYKRYNYGVFFLRMLLTFIVILNHFWNAINPGIIKPLFLLRSCAVPTFMLLSFFLTEKTITTSSFEKLKRRILRLATPFFVWGGVSWITLFIAEKILKKDIIDGFNALFWQLITGHDYYVNAPLWYMAVLIWLTILYYVIFRLPNKRISFVIIQVIAVVALILQYTGVNYAIFKYLPFETKYPLGRVAEMIPYATLGFDIAHLKIYDQLRKNKLHETISLWASLTILIILLAFGNEPNRIGFGYNGILRMIISISILTFFYLLPFGSISKRTVNSIKVITAHTLGIYCLHYLVGNVLNYGLERLHISINQIVFCAVLYSICYAVSTVISRISSGLLKQLVD